MAQALFGTRSGWPVGQSNPGTNFSFAHDSTKSNCAAIQSVARLTRPVHGYDWRTPYELRCEWERKEARLQNPPAGICACKLDHIRMLPNVAPKAAGLRVSERWPTIVWLGAFGPRDI
jgi:hypothetical protein